MQVTLEVPDDVVERLAPQGQNPARAALEAWAIEGYRSGSLSTAETRRLLGFETRYELDGFLKSHKVWDHAYSVEDLQDDRSTLRQLEESGALRT